MRPSWRPPAVTAPQLRYPQVIEGHSSSSPTSWSHCSASSLSPPAHLMASDPARASCPHEYDPTKAHAPGADLALASNATVSATPTSPTPFLTKTYELVDDPNTNSVISWGNAGKSFVVWNPAHLCQHLLPRYFRHSNFSSFVRQLNTYGFHKVSSDKWEFANDEFQRGQRHLLGAIYRRRRCSWALLPAPLQADQSCPSTTKFSSCGVKEVTDFGKDDEKESLRKDNIVITRELLSLQQKLQSTMGDLRTMWQQLQIAETCQHHMISFIFKAMHNPGFLAQIKEQSGVMAAGNVVPHIVPEKRQLRDVQLTTSSPDHLYVVDKGARTGLLSENVYMVTSPHVQLRQITVEGMEARMSIQAKANWREKQITNSPVKADMDELVNGAKLMSFSTLNNSYDNVYPYGRSVLAQDSSLTLSTPSPINQSILHPYEQKWVPAVSSTLREHMTMPHFSGHSQYQVVADGSPPLHHIVDKYQYSVDKSSPAHINGYGRFNAADTCSTMYGAAVDDPIYNVANPSGWENVHLSYSGLETSTPSQQEAQCPLHLCSHGEAH